MPAPTEITIKQLLALDANLRSLVGYEENGVSKRFVVDEKTKWNITKNLRILKAEREQYDEHRTEKIKELSPKKLNIDLETAEVRGAFFAWHEGILKMKVKVDGLLTLKRSALLRPDEKNGLPQNNIPEDVLEVLFDLIEDDIANS